MTALRSVALLAACLAAATGASAQVAVERKLNAAAGKDVRIGVYANVKSDCTAGPLPTLAMTQSPQNGAIKVLNAKVRLTNHKSCLSTEVPGLIATYRAKAGFSGTDTIMIEVKNPAGAVIQKQTITITVSGGDGISL